MPAQRHFRLENSTSKVDRRYCHGYTSRLSICEDRVRLLSLQVTRERSSSHISVHAGTVVYSTPTVFGGEERHGPLAREARRVL